VVVERGVSGTHHKKQAGGGGGRWCSGHVEGTVGVARMWLGGGAEGGSLCLYVTQVQKIAGCTAMGNALFGGWWWWCRALQPGCLLLRMT
jgi:hypothetical protein